MSRRSPRVVVLDDDAAFNELMADLLPEEGFRFVEAPRDREPIDALADARADVAIVDLRGMIAEGALPLLRRLRADSRLEALPILVCSADVKQLRDIALALARVPRVAVLEKPFEIDALTGALEALLAGSPQMPAGGGAAPRHARQALEQHLAQLGSTLRWPVVDAWVPDRHPGLLRCAATWVASDELGPFADRSRRLRLPGGGGLQGRVWISRRPAWIEDLARDMSFAGRRTAQRIGLISAAGVPVLDAGDMIGVIDLYDVRRRRSSPSTLERMRRAAADAAPLLRAAAGSAVPS